MRIYDKRTPTTVPFKDIHAGECFIDPYDNELNIKIEVSSYNVKGDYPNAVALNSGYPWICNDDEQVIKVRTTVTIDA